MNARIVLLYTANASLNSQTIIIIYQKWTDT